LARSKNGPRYCDLNCISRIASCRLSQCCKCEELCKLKVSDFAHARRGVPHLKVEGKGEKMRFLPLHPGTNALIHDYLEAAGHAGNENGALFRPIKNNRGKTLDKALTPFPFGEHRRPGYSVGWTCGGGRRAARSLAMICCRHSMPSLVKAVTPSSPMP
jgi:hypothetical protein